MLNKTVNFIFLAILIISGLFFSPSVLSAIDAIEEIISQDYPAALRWENIEGGKIRLSGENVNYSIDHRLHVIRLKKNQHIKIHLNQSQMLRILNLSDPILTDGLVLTVSNGTSLYSSLKPLSDGKNKNLIIKPNNSGNRIIKISSKIEQEITFALFVSRLDFIKRLTPYRNLIDLPLDRVDLVDHSKRQVRKYWMLDHSDSVSLPLADSKRIALQVRLNYHSNEHYGNRPFHLSYSFDNDPPEEIHLRARQEYNHYYTINRQGAPVAQVETVYIDIPDDKQTFQLKSSDNLYLRILALNEPDYLLPTLNDNPISVQQARTIYEQHTVKNKNIAALLMTQPQSQSQELYNMQWIATFIAINNELRDSAMDAISLLENSAGNVKGLKQAKQFAETFRRQYTFYRNLYPYHNNSGQGFSVQQFILYPLKQWNLPTDSYHMFNANFSNTCESLNQSHFFSLPQLPDKALIYHLPERVHDSRLRVIVDQLSVASDGYFYMQFDNNEKVKYSVSEKKELPDSFFNPSTAEACVSRSRYKGDILFPIQLGNNLINAAFLDVSLPANVKTIKLWKPYSTHVNHSPRIALQYQAAKPYKMSQQFYMNLIGRHNEKLLANVFVPFIHDEEIANQELSKDQLYRLTQNWRPLKAFLLSREKLFSLSFINDRKNPSKHYSDEQTVETVYKKILSSQKKDQWLNIIEQFSALNIHPEHERYVPIYTYYFNALEQLGEYNLRERILKGVILFDSNSELRHRAYELLKNYYEQYDYPDKLTRLLVTRTYQNRDEADYKSLVFHLISQGYDAFALQLGLLLQQDELLNEKLLHAALNKKNWYYFDALVRNIKEPRKQITWKALKALSLGDRVALDTYLSQLESEKSFYIDYLKAVLSVHESTLLNNAQEFIKQWRLWSQWKLRVNTDKLWRPNDTIISDAEGGELLYNLERDSFKNYFRVSSKHPVKLSVIGPARIRIGVRVLYQDIKDELKKSLLLLSDNDKQFISPLSKSVPSQGLKIIGRPEAVVGSVQYFEYAIGDGIHEIAYKVKDYPALTTISTQQLSITEPTLPDILTPDMLSHIISRSTQALSDSNSRSIRQCQQEGCIILHDEESFYLKRLLSNNEQPKPSVTVLQKDIYESNIDDFFPIHGVNINYLTSQFNQLCLFEHSKKQLPVQIEPLNNFSKTIKAEIQKCIPSINQLDTAIELLGQMAWYSNQFPESRKTIEAMAGSILEFFSDNPEINRFWVLFEQQHHWQLQSNIAESAGIRFESVKGWHPVTPYGRIRKALLQQHSVSTVLMDNQISAIRLSNHVDSQLFITFKNLTLPFHPGTEVALRFQLNEQAWRYISFQSPELERQLSIPVPSGNHILKLQWLNPISGQYVGIKVLTIKNQQRSVLYNEFDRYYHIASSEEPVKTYIDGPSRLRIDYQLDGQIHSEFIFIPPGMYKLTLPVFKNKDRVMYRIYKYVPDNYAPSPQSSVIDRDIVKLPFSQWYEDVVSDIITKDTNQPVQVIDKYTLGRQEDGTLSLGVLWTEGEDREDNINNATDNDYFQYSFSHYYFVEQWQSYFDTSLLYRNHDAGEPSFGVEQTIFYKPHWLSFAFRLNWKYFTQDYDSPDGTRRAWSTNVRFGIEQLFTLSPKLSHLPRLTVFHKNYDNSGFVENTSTDIDHDVWNEYGDIHDRGLILSDTLYYYPWLDTRLSTGFSYFSDEDFRLDKPEHLSLRFGWLQIMDRVLLDLNYRWTHYFSEDGHDWNRSSSSSKGVINTNLFWDSWLFPSQRLMANLKLSYDTKIDDMTATIGFNYYFDEGRGFRDFRPHTESFRDMRERYRFWDQNNLLINENQ